MRINRGALFLALSLMLAVVPVAGARILGALTPRKSDCYLVFEGINANQGKNGVTCTDGDPSCDGDAVKGQCTFNFTICAAETDTGVVGCNPGSVIKIKPNPRNGLVYPQIPTSGPACAATPSSIVLALKKHGTRPNKRTLNFFAVVATGSPKRDNDRLTLRCNPAPASPSGAFVMREE